MLNPLTITLTPSSASGQCADASRWVRRSDPPPGRTLALPALERHLAHSKMDGDAVIVAAGPVLAEVQRVEFLTTDDGVCVGDGWFAPVSGREFPPFVSSRLEDLKRRVGVAKLQVGAEGWRTAVTFVDRFSNLTQLHRVPSRAYFKMAEIVRVLSTTPTNALHLCEAPGGFAVCVQDTWACTASAHSLSGPNAISFRPLPMRVSRLDGLPANADLIETAVVDQLAQGGRTFDLVTADGSADHDGEPVAVERNHHLLACREAAVALLTLREGGSFVLKLFDLALANTHRLLFAVASTFARAQLVKPLSSRATNGEVYLVCQGFRVGAVPTTALTSMRHSPTPLDGVALSAHWRTQTARAFNALARAQADALQVLFDFIEREKMPPPDASEELWASIRPPFTKTLACHNNGRKRRR